LEDLAGRTIIWSVPPLAVAAPGLLFGVVSVNDREVARVRISVRQKTSGETSAGADR
jgi:hypothetical protein